MSNPPIDQQRLNEFVRRLESLGARYTIKKARPEALMVLVTTARERWEIEFMTLDWGRIEVERYESLGPADNAKVLPELWERLGLPSTPDDSHERINDFLNTLDRANVHYEVINSGTRGLTVRLYAPGQYWEVSFSAESQLAIERFESSGEISDESSLETLWDLLNEEQ